jgi:fluoroquinolone resistance protein
MSNKYFEDESFNSTNFPAVGDLISYEFVGCEFINIDFSSRQIKHCKFIECQFNKSNLSNIQVLNSIFRDVAFSECKVMGVNFSNADTLVDMKFTECLMDLCVFQNLEIKGSQFIKSSLKEVDFAECNLENSIFTGSDLKEAVFNNSNLMKANFLTAFNYSIDIRFNEIKKAKFDLPEAVSLLRSLDIILS